MEKTVINSFHKGIVLEDVRSFESSIFNKVYKNACRLVTECISSRNESAKLEKNQRYPDNIITFVGRRGTGKTSSMFSFMNVLKENDNLKEDSPFKIRDSRGESINFLVVDWIDASMLEKGEDIFEMLLAKMLNEILQDEEKGGSFEAIQDYGLYELHNHFAKVYKMVLNIKKRNNSLDYNGENAISALRELARSSDLRIEFEELISKYISFKKRQMSGRNRQEQYAETCLVLAIDDIDMNVNFGFDILDKIQRYLRVEKLLVLLALNYEQMELCCEKHFSHMYDGNLESLSGEKQIHVTKVAEQYLEKAIPSYMRIYLPSLKKRDYDKDHDVRLEIDGIKAGKDVFIKKGMFLLAEKKTLVRYDGKGKKKHFIEPDTLRRLNNEYFLYDSMEDLSEEDDAESFREKLSRNMRKSMDDLLFRFTFECMPEKERRFLIRLSEEDIRRRGELIVSTLLRKIRLKDPEQLIAFDRQGNDIQPLFSRDYDVFGYSYGELLRSFYFYSREEIYDRSLVHGFLAMYSLVMTKIFYRYKKLELGTRAAEKRNYSMLKEIMQSSAAGSWAVYIMPKIKIERDFQILYAGAAVGVNMQDIHIPAEISGGSSAEDKLTLAEKINSLETEILLLLFVTPTHGRDESFYEEIFNLRIKGNSIQPIRSETNDADNDADEYADPVKQKISFENAEADYNVLNFVNNIFIFHEITDAIILAVCGDDAEQKEAVKDELLKKEDGLYSEMKKWTASTGGFVLPVYAADIYYNMLKRIAREMKRNPVELIGKDQLFEQLKKLFSMIEKKLYEADEIYGDSHFKDIWTSCPVIKRLRKGDGGLEKKYNDFVHDLLKSESNKCRKLTELERTEPFLD